MAPAEHRSATRLMSMRGMCGVMGEERMDKRGEGRSWRSLRGEGELHGEEGYQNHHQQNIPIA